MINLVLFKMSLKKELKIYGVGLWILAIADLSFGLLLLFLTQGHLFIAILTILIGSSLIFVGTLPFVFTDKKIFMAYAAAMVALLLQFLILNKMLGLSTWGSVFFLLMVGFFIGKAGLRPKMNQNKKRIIKN